MPRSLIVLWGLVCADFGVGLLCLLAMNWGWIHGEGGLAIIPVLWGSIAAFPILAIVAGVVTHRNSVERRRGWDKSLARIGRQEKGLKP